MAGTEVRRRGIPRQDTLNDGDTILINPCASTNSRCVVEVLRFEITLQDPFSKICCRIQPIGFLKNMLPEDKPAWLDDLRCASTLEKTFLYEEVFGAWRTLHSGRFVSPSYPVFRTPSSDIYSDVSIQYTTAGGSYFDEGVCLPAAPAESRRKKKRAAETPQQPLNIIDVGGNIGLFALYCLEHSQGHIGRLITLEPIQETYDLLLHNLDVFFDHTDSYLDVIPLRVGLTEDRAGRKTDEFYVFPRALGWSGRSEGVNPDAIRRDLRRFIDNALDDPDSQSLALPRMVRSLAVALKLYVPFLYALVVFLATKVLMFGAKRVQCPTSTLSTVIEEYIEEGERVSLIKIDVEGGELNVLRGLEARHWDVVDQMVLECTVENLGEVLKLIDARGQFENVVAKQTDDLQGTSLWMIYCS
jgi:hypothetical protein